MQAWVLRLVQQEKIIIAVFHVVVVIVLYCKLSITAATAAALFTALALLLQAVPG